MTDTSTLTYQGPHRLVRQVLPDRTITVARGDRVEVTADELDHLDPTEWIGDRHEPADADPEAPFAPLGTVKDVLAEAAAHPEQAAGLLERERAGQDRASLVSRLEAIVDQHTTIDAQPGVATEES